MKYDYFAYTCIYITNLNVMKRKYLAALLYPVYVL